MNDNTPEPLHPLIGGTIGLVIGFPMGALAMASMLMQIWGIVLACVVAFTAAIVTRAARIVNPILKGARRGLLVGEVAGVMILAWVSIQFEFEYVNRIWFLLIFFSIQSVVERYISEQMLARWMRRFVPRLVPGDEQLAGR